MSKSSKYSNNSSNAIDRWFNQLLGRNDSFRKPHRERPQQELWQKALNHDNQPATDIKAGNEPGRVHHKRKAKKKKKGGGLDSLNQVVASVLEAFEGFKRTKKAPRKKRLKSKDFSRPDANYFPGQQPQEGQPFQPVSAKKRSLRKKVARKPKTQSSKIWNYLPHEWRPTWENFLYKLYLRDMPYDPFLNSGVVSEKPKMTVKWLEEGSFTLSSLVVFIASGLFAWLVYQLSVVVVASLYDIDSVLYYYEVMFPIGNASAKWNSLNIIAITLAGPLFSLLAGVFTYFYLIRKKVVRGFNRLFFLWLSFHLFNFFFGGFVAGVITDQGFGYVANWMFMGMVMKILISLIFLSILGFAGYYVVPWLLATAGKPQRIRSENRVIFIISQVVVPWIVGSGLLLLLRIPNRPPQHSNILIYDAIIASTLGVMAIAMFFNRNARPATVSHRKTNYRVSFIWAVATLLAILLVRVGLSYGLHIVMQFSIRLSLFNI